MVLDSLNNPFYWHDNEARSITFNLPPGGYHCNVPLEKKRHFMPYGHKPYPKLNKAFLRKVQVFPLKNPNKASISLERSIIFADPKFYYNKYKPLKTFTLCHEVFHSVFHSKTRKEKDNPYIHEFIEMQCDTAAKNFMLANGWNPLQVRIAVKLLLRSKNRNNCIHRSTTHPKNGFRR